MSKEVYYGDYLQLDKILGAQLPESDLAKVEAHDEMLFIITHQAYELWFKQILHEIDSIKAIFGKNQINDNDPDLSTVVHRMKRVIKILELAVNQISIMETMTPLDFLDFRDLLRPASGFQSYQFKFIEASLGLKLNDRHGKEYYLSHLRQNHIEAVQEIESQPSIIEAVNAWLERMPFIKDENASEINIPEYWKAYITAYDNTLVDGEKENTKRFKELLFNPEFTKDRRLSNKANRSALFIMLYRDYPLLQAPYQLLNCLLEIDEQMATWRYRHMNMVHRMIGTRVGTGGSSGKNYLKAALDKHYIFQEIAELTSFLVERRKIPVLPADLEDRLRFNR